MASAGLRGSGKAKDKPNGGSQPEKRPSPLLPSLSSSYCPARRLDSLSCSLRPPPRCYGWVQSGGTDGRTAPDLSASLASSHFFSLLPSHAVPIYPSPRPSFSTVLASNSASRCSFPLSSAGFAPCPHARFDDIAMASAWPLSESSLIGCGSLPGIAD